MLNLKAVKRNPMTILKSVININNCKNPNGQKQAEVYIGEAQKRIKPEQYIRISGNKVIFKAGQKRGRTINAVLE